jgi:hypothetical protein
MMTDRWLLEETVERLRDLTVQVNRMDAELAQHRLQLGERPEWANAMLEAVTQITPSRALQAKVELLGEELAALQSGCDARHSNDPIPSIVPRNGNGG